MNESRRPETIALGLLGAAIGGCAGYFAFFWIARQGFYALILPPALLGLTAGYFARCRSTPLAIVCAIAGLALGLYTEWRYAPFIKDDSFPFFLTHMHHVKPIKLLMLALGVFICYRFALGVDRKSDVV
jgi:hypothetical protein